jgi:hypothetical protein
MTLVKDGMDGMGLMGWDGMDGMEMGKLASVHRREFELSCRA